jgi:hypothetical protein
MLDLRVPGLPGGQEGKVIMTGKRVFGMLAVIALVAMSATGAHAGAGGTPSTLTSFFLCKSISGQAVGQRVDIESTDAGPTGTGAGWGITLDNVKIGVATLACSFARLFPAGDANHIACDPTQPPNSLCNEISPIPVDTNGDPVNGRDLKCYAISASRGQNSPQPSYTATDGLLGTDPNVNGSGVNYLCAPARFNQNVGQ